MEDCLSNTPTGESNQIGASGHAGAVARRNAAARNYAETGDPRARDYAIEQHGIAEGHRTQDEKRG